MKNRLNRLVMLLSIVVVVPTLGAGPEPHVSIQNVVPDGSGFQLQTIVSDPPEGAPEFTMLTEEGEVLAKLGSGEKEAVNLWLLVDSSTLCRKKGIDERINGLIPKLRTHLHRDSILSLVSYTNTTLEIHHNHRAVREIEDSVVSCDNTLLSTSFEKPLQHLLAARETSRLPTVIWVYTSGNIDLSAEVLAKLKKRSAELHVVLFNPFVAKEVKPVLASTEAALGAENVRFSVLGAESPLLPEIRRRLEFSAPYELRGKRVRTRLGILANDKVVRSAAFNLNIPEGNVFLERYLRLALLVVALGLIVYIAFRVYQFYKGRYCVECARRMRHSDPGCLFCSSTKDAYLIGAFNHRNKHKLGKSDVVRLVADTVEIGTHRRSVVPLVKSSQKRRACYVTIIREALAKNQFAYRLVRNASDDSIQISVNGNPIKNARYLSAGDTLEIDGLVLSFYSGLEDSDVA